MVSTCGISIFCFGSPYVPFFPNLCSVMVRTGPNERGGSYDFVFMVSAALDASLPLRKKRSHDNTQATTLGSAGWSRNPTLRPSAKADRLFTKSNQLGNGEIDWYGPAMAIPVVSGFRIQAVSPRVFRVV